jgi:protein involved in polysaccharide export with SLBB domain
MFITLHATQWRRIVLVGAFFAGIASSALAQRSVLPNVPDITNTQRTIQVQRAGQQNVNDLTPNIEIYQPVIPEERTAPPPSRLETLYATRAGAVPGTAAGTAGVESRSGLSQYGYDILGVPSSVSAAQLGSAQDDYVLGEGDEIVVVLRGQEDVTYHERINRNGQVIFPRFNPVQAAGRTLRELRSDLEQQVSQIYISTNVFVSLGEVRQISVLVTGEVRAPGVRILNALATPLDALLISGGISKTGSLRNVTLVRGNQTRTVDFYALLNQGNAAILGTLQNGDRIYVPPLENSIAVSGLVRRPGIYELRNGETGLTADALIRLAGGFEIAGAYRLSKMRLEPDGSTRLVPLANNGVVANGEILFVDNAIDQRTDLVRLRGAVKLQNSYPLSAAGSVHQLIRSVNDLTPDAYTAFALLVRRDLALNIQVVQPFSLARVLSGQQDVALQNEDLVYVFTLDEVRGLAAAVAAREGGDRQSASSLAPRVGQSASSLSAINSDPRLSSSLAAGAVGRPSGTAGVANAGTSAMSMNGGTTGQEGSNREQTVGASGLAVPGIDANAGVVGNGGVQNDTGIGNSLRRAPIAATAATEAIAEAQAAILRESGQVNPNFSTARVASNLGVPEQVLAGTVQDNLVYILDEVRNPGVYLAASGTSVGEMSQMAGGPLRTADLSSIEVTSTTIDAASGTSRTTRTIYKGSVEDLKKVTLLPLDVVRFRPIFADREQGRITITGEVRYPGTFDIVRGEHLSDVLRRAGGLTSQAYPYGAISTRRSAAIAESEGNQREARELESALASAIQTGAIGSATSVSIQSGGGVPGEAEGVIGNLITELRTAPTLGRIAVTADPSVLTVKPELDIIVDAGDTLYIPKRPSTVTVTGEVLNSGSFQFRSDLAAVDYLDMAGGTRRSADRGRIFIVLPDGSARPLENNWFSFSKGSFIAPGSTIIVPRDVAPFNLNQFVRDTTQIMSQLAITAASIAILGAQ